MDNDISVPLVLLDPSEAPGEADPMTFGGAEPLYQPIPSDNFSTDEAFKKFWLEQVWPVVEWCRINRMNLEEEWRAIRRMRVQMHDYGRRYFGRSDYYLPMYGKIRGTLVSSMRRGLFPSDEYMDVQSRDNSDPESSKPVKALLQWEFEENGEVLRHMDALLGQQVDWGNTVLKVFFRKELRRVVQAARERGVGEDGVSLKNVAKALREGLAVSTRNMLYWFGYPFTADGLQDCTLCFEDVEVARGWGEEMIRKGIWRCGSDAAEAVNYFHGTRVPPNYLVTQQDLMTNTWGITPPATGIMGDRKLGDTRVMQEIWTYGPCPDSQLMDGEMPGEFVPLQIVAGGQNVFIARRNPHWHQRAPYLFSASNREPGNLHGYAEGRMYRPLQYLGNDLANQVNDAGIYSLNPISKVNPAYFIGAVPPIKPGGAWKMMDIEQGHKFDRPPAELIQYGLQLLGFWQNAGQDFAGTPPVMQGSQGGKTATSTSILARNAASPIQARVESLEQDIMVPLMRMTWSNAMQFRDESTTIAVMGEMMKVTRAMLAGDWAFRWLASSQAVNQSQRAQQLMMFVQGLAPMIPLLNQLGYVVDPEPLFRRVYSDGLGGRGFADIVKKAQAAPAGGPPQPGQPPAQGVQAEQADRVRSALEQVYGQGGAPEMQPGEGDDFQQVRSEADRTAAAIGRQSAGQA